MSRSLLLFILLFSRCLLLAGCSDNTQIKEEEGKVKFVLTDVDFVGAPIVNFDGDILLLASDYKTLISFDELGGSQVLVRSQSAIYSPKYSSARGEAFYLSLSDLQYTSELLVSRAGSNESVKLTNLSHGDVTSFVLVGNSKLAFVAFDDIPNTESVYIVDLDDDNKLIKIAGLDTRFRHAQLVYLKHANRIALVNGPRIDIIDPDTAQLITTIQAPNKVFHLNSAGYLSSFIEGYYQIFYLNEGLELSQVTTSHSHKWFPKISTDQFLYYIDAGVNVDFDTLYKFQWLYSANSGRSYQDYLNNWGRTAWTETSTLEFLNLVVSQTADQYFASVLAEHILSVIASSDLYQGTVDHNGVSQCGWSATRYSIDKQHKIRHSVHDAMIGEHIAEFALFENVNNALFGLESDERQRVHDFLECLYQENMKHWRDAETDQFGIVDEDEGYLVIPKGSAERFDGINVPFNYQNKFGGFVARLQQLKPDADKLTVVEKLINVFVRHLNELDDEYYWHYWWGPGFDGWTEESSYSINTPESGGTKSLASPSYARIDLEFLLSFYHKNNAIPSDLLSGIVATFENNSKMSLDKISTWLLLKQFTDTDVSIDPSAYSHFLNIQLRYLPLLSQYIENIPSIWQLAKVKLGESVNDPSVVEVPYGFVTYDVNHKGVIFIQNSVHKGYSLRLE